MKVEVDNLKTAVSERIRQARTSLGMTQKDFCAATGIPLPSLRNYELSKVIPGGDAINNLLSIGISSNWLLTGTGEMFLAKPPETSHGKLRTVVLMSNEPAAGSYVAAQEAGKTEEPYDSSREVLEAALRVMEYKFISQQTNPHIIETALDMVVALMPIATERYPLLALRLKVMETAYSFLKAGLNEAGEGSS